MFRIFAAVFFSLAAFAFAADEPPKEFPKVRGDYQMTKEWRVTLPDEYSRRFETTKGGKEMVLWREGITCWTSVFSQQKGEKPEETYAWRKSSKPKATLQTFEFTDTKPLRLGFLLHEKEKDVPERWALYTFTFGESGHVMMSIFFDREQDIELARKIWMSIAETAK